MPRPSNNSFNKDYIAFCCRINLIPNSHINLERQVMCVRPHFKETGDEGGFDTCRDWQSHNSNLGHLQCHGVSSIPFLYFVVCQGYFKL